LYITVQNPSENSFFYIKNNNKVLNPEVGTLVDSSIIENKDEFYLFSESRNEFNILKMATKYRIIESNLKFK
jgi:hypothetical protein